MVEYPICLLNILDKVYNVEPIQCSTYPLAWLTEAEQSCQGHLPGPSNVSPPASWPIPAPQVQAGSPRQGQAKAGNAGRGKQTGGQQQQGGDSRHPCIKALMDPYLAVNSGQLNITHLFDVASKLFEDLQTLLNYTNLQGWSSICCNWILGRCGYGRACMFWHGHVKHEDVTDAFADSVCDVIGKSVVHLMNNGGTNAPPPPDAKKQKVTVETGTCEE